MSVRKVFTEKESLVNNQIMLFRLTKLLEKETELFYHVCEAMPFSVHINKVGSLDSTYLNPQAEYLMGMDMQSVVDSGYELIKTITHTPTLRYISHTISNYQNIADRDAVCSYYQYMKLNGRWQWILSYKKFIDRNFYLNIGFPLKGFAHMGVCLDKILNETFVRQDGWQKFQSLSKREKQLLKMFAEGDNRKEIGEKLFISENTVRTHRQKIMKKIEAGSINDIIRFTQAFEIIGQI